MKLGNIVYINCIYINHEIICINLNGINDKNCVRNSFLM